MVIILWTIPRFSWKHFRDEVAVTTLKKSQTNSTVLWQLITSCSKNIKGSSLSSFSFFFFNLAHTFFPNHFPLPTPQPHPSNLPAGIHVQTKIAKLTAQYWSRGDPNYRIHTVFKAASQAVHLTVKLNIALRISSVVT